LLRSGPLLGAALLQGLLRLLLLELLRLLRALHQRPFRRLGDEAQRDAPRLPVGCRSFRLGPRGGRRASRALSSHALAPHIGHAGRGVPATMPYPLPHRRSALPASSETMKRSSLASLNHSTIPLAIARTSPT